MKRVNLGSVAIVLIVVGCVIVAVRTKQAIQARLQSLQAHRPQAPRFVDRYRATVLWTPWHAKKSRPGMQMSSTIPFSAARFR